MEKESKSSRVFEHVVDQMNRLKAKTISLEEAKIQANLSKQANNTLRYELDRAKTMAVYPQQLEQVEK